MAFAPRVEKQEKPSRPSSHLSHDYQAGRQKENLTAKLRPIANARNKEFGFFSYLVSSKSFMIEALGILPVDRPELQT